MGLRAEGFGVHAGSHPLEGISRGLKGEEQLLEPGEIGLEGEEQGLKPSEHGLEGESFALQGMRSEVEAGGFPGTIQLDRSCLLDLLAQIARRSLVTGVVLARASLTPRIAEASASQSLPSHLHRSG